MSILRRAVVMLIVAGILSSAADVFAKGPRTRIFATLTATAAAPKVAKGKAKLDQSASRTNFSVEAENLRSLNGQTALIFVNGTQVGSTVIALGRAKLELTNERGGSVPAVSAGTKVEINVGLTTILSGSF
jgi:hypothetical protein